MNGKTINCKKKNEKRFLEFEIFFENYPPTRHIKHKRTDFAPFNKSIIANKLLLPTLERFLGRSKPHLMRDKR